MIKHIQRGLRILFTLLVIFIGVIICTNPADSLNTIKNITSKDNQPLKQLLSETGHIDLTDTEISTDDTKNSSSEGYQTSTLYKAQVVAEVDGDTFYVLIDGESEEKKVRLIGVNCEESVHEDETKNTQAGIEASNYTKEQLPVGTTVWLQFDQGTKDDYDRWLVYVWTKEDVDIESQNDVIDYMYNANLVINNHATPMTIEPNTKYSKLFERLEEIKNSAKSN